MIAASYRRILACFLGACLLATAASAAAAPPSAREMFDAEQTQLGQGARLGQWSQWQYEAATLSDVGGLDFNFAWGYVDAAAAEQGDVMVAVVRNHSAYTYCVRPRVSFVGKVSQVQTVDTSVAIAPGTSLRIASLRVARRTEVVHDINAAFWPAPMGSGPARCSAAEPAGLASWLAQRGEAPFPGNRVVPPAPAPAPAR